MLLGSSSTRSKLPVCVLGIGGGCAKYRCLCSLKRSTSLVEDTLDNSTPDRNGCVLSVIVIPDVYSSVINCCLGNNLFTFV